MEPITFSTEDTVRLEGEILLPEGAPRGSAVVCHPHPRHGGSKDHPILWAVRNELAHRGLAVLVFNFRGVMGSAGTFGGGHAELRDTHAAIGRIREEAPDLPTVACGWSFGASVALREALDDDRVAALALIGLPLQPGDVELPALPEATALGALRVPTLLLAGDRDEFCPSEDLRAFGDRFRTARVEILADTNHYLWRHERAAAALIGEFVDGVLGGPVPGRTGPSSGRTDPSPG